MKKALEKAFLQYYDDLLGKEKMLNKKVSNRVIKEWEVLNEQQRQGSCRQFTGEDVKRALFDIEDTKSPGPDNYTSDSFKAA